MTIPTLKQQMFGDLNKQLNRIRARMNDDIRERCFEIIEKAPKKPKSL